MSLVCWLPLNGNLNDNGCGMTTITNSGATVNSSGKIGSCYAFDGTDDYIALSGTKLFNCFKGANQPFSVAMWVLHADSTRAILFGDYATSGGVGFNIELYESHVVRFYWNSSPDYLPSGMNVGTNVWHHIALTYDGSSIKSYLDGVLCATRSGVLNALNKTTGEFRLGRDNRTGFTALNGRLNDVRIYDNCLSQAEIHEISQGLMLHYKLDGRVLGNPNLLLNTHFDTRYSQSTGWDTTKNGTLLASSWGGYNSGVANASTCYHAHLKQLNNEYVYEYIKESETWLGISQGGLQSKLTAGKTYTFSCEQYSVTNTNYMTAGLYYFKTGATSASFHLGQMSCNSNRIQGTWQKFTYTFTAPSDGDYSKNMSWYCYGHSGAAGIFYLRHLKLEEGSVATPWAPAATEANHDRSIIEDTSGYGHNGIVNGTISLSLDTPRYSCSTVFNGSNTRIQVPNLTPNELTISFWMKRSANTGTRQFMYTAWSGITCELQTNGIPTFAVYRASYPTITGTAITTDSGWVHYCATFDTINGSKLYQNGILKSSNNNVTPIAYSISTNYIGYYNTYYNGLMSDFRIYATALSADDIQQLYQVGAKIDNHGNIHTYNLSEELSREVDAKFVNNSATSMTYDVATDTYTIISPAGTSSWGYGVRLADTPALEVPYGMTYRWTAEVWTPVALTVQTDYNNTATTTWAGNDNDATSTRLASSNAIPANTWTRIYRGASNTNASNTNHLSIRDYSSLGLITNGQSGPVTWKVRHLQWYLVDTTFNPQIKKTGVFEAERFTEVEQNLNKPAQFNKQMFSVNGNEFIEI